LSSDFVADRICWWKESMDLQTTDYIKMYIKS